MKRNKTIQQIWFFVLSLIFGILLIATTRSFADDLLLPGDFSKMSAAEIAQMWGVNPDKGSEVKQTTETRFIRLTMNQPRTHVMVYRRVDLPQPAPKSIEISLKVRYKEIEHGDQNWNDGRFIVNFKDNSGKTLSPGPHVPTFLGTSEEWKEIQYIAAVPEGAQFVEFMPYMLQPQSGTLDFARIEARSSAKSVPAPAPKPKRVVPFVASTVQTPRHVAKLSKPLHVAGNRIVDPAGNEVWLQGVCVDSLQWCGGGEHILDSIPQALDVWHANVIRLPVTEEFWFGRNQWQNDGGKGYRELIDKAVAQCAVRKAYLVLDLHRFGAPTQAHKQFWADAATRYRNHPAVLFELFNEPHDISWEVWRDGEAQSKSEQERSIGLQALVDTVRAAGAQNPVIVGGLDWSYDLSEIASGKYLLRDAKGGSGIIYSSHVYPWKKDWARNFLAAAKTVPLFIGETGNIRSWDDFSFIQPEARTEKVGVGSPWPTDMLGVIQKYRLNWTGFSFHPSCGPQILKDWTYAPTEFWGVYVRDALNGKAFKTQNLR